MIEIERIEHIKAASDLKFLVESRGIQLKKNGKGWFGLYPFHDDKNPSLSITPLKNEWHCFGCGAGGDVIRFVELFDRVIEFYHAAFAEDDRARQYLKTRGITDNALFADYWFGFANGTLLNVLPDDDKITRQLKEIGILNANGKEHFYGCAVFPLFDPDGNPAGMYGRRIDGMANGADHLYLPGNRNGLFNRQAVKTNKEIILTESILDSLTLINYGFKNTSPCYGVNGFTDAHLNLFRQYNTQTIYICLDPDESGIKAAEAIQHTLESNNLKGHCVTLPEGQDLNDFFLLTAHPVEEFKRLLNQANPGAYPEEKQRVIQTEYGFVMTTGNRTYEVRGLIKKNTSLKATVKGIDPKKRMHVDTVDFYSARSRTFLIKGLCNLFGVEETVITDDMAKLLEQAEQYRVPDQDKKTAVAMTEKDRANK